jgi:drug/metabolite transporter (DMT)-like permease
VTMNSVGMGFGALVLIVLALLFGETIAVPRDSDTWLAVGYLVIVGSGIVFVLYVLVLRYWSASRVAYGFAITPVVTVLVSAWLLDEPVGIALVAGGALVLAGVYVGVVRAVATDAPEAAAVPEPSGP